MYTWFCTTLMLHYLYRRSFQHRWYPTFGVGTQGGWSECGGDLIVLYLSYFTVCSLCFWVYRMYLPFAIKAYFFLGSGYGLCVTVHLLPSFLQ